MQFLVIAATVAVLLAALYFLRQRANYAPGLPPYVHGLLPYVGCTVGFASNPLKFATEMYEKHGEVYTLNILGKRLTFLVGPEAHAPFLAGNDRDMDQNEPYRFAVPLFGPGVVYDVDLATRNQQLRFMRDTLKTNNMKIYVDLIVEETELFFKKWANEGVVDLRQELSELIILTASRCLMGEEIRENLSGEVARLFQQLDEGLMPISVFFPYLPIPKHRKRDEARLEIVELFSKVIRERNAHPEVRHDDVLQMFMEATYKDGKKLTDAEIGGLMVALLFAGQHTSSITSTWTGLFLLDNKERWMPSALEEQKRVLEEFNGKLDYESLQQMDFLHRCIKEALRINPPLIFLMRKLNIDVDICGFRVPKGDTLFLSPALSGRLGSVFKEPMTFDPDRFAPPREEDKVKPFSFVGFGGGRHGCMGETFAYLQIKTIWSVLLRDFEMELVGDFPEPDYTAMVVGPTQPCQIRYKRIRAAN